MKFLKLMQVNIEVQSVIQRGHALINLEHVRKIVKIRDPLGGHCCKISFNGLGKEHDIYVAETPEDIALLCSGKGAELQLKPKDDFKAIKVRVQQFQKPSEPSIQFEQERQFVEQHMTKIEEVDD